MNLPVVHKNQKHPVGAEVARLLREERIKRRFSLNELARRAGLSQQMVSYVEREMRTPTLETLLRLADALDTDLWKILKKASS